MKVNLGVLKGKKLREPQIEAIDFVKSSKKKFTVIRAPTGVGKSLCGMESFTPPLFYLCSSIQLQNQLKKDFPEAVLLKGQSNYLCIREQSISVDLCFLNKKCSDCAYLVAKKKLMDSLYGILNFHYFLTVMNYTEKQLGKTRIVVIDEADMMDNILISFVSFEFTFDRLARMVEFEIPKLKTKIEVMSGWLNKLSAKVLDQIFFQTGEIKEILEKPEVGKTITAVDTLKLRQYKRLEGLNQKVSFLLTQDLSTNWIYHHNDERIVLKPKWLGREITDKFLFNHGDQFLFMSASIPSKPVFCALFGLKAQEVDYLDLPSPFPTIRRKVFCTNDYNATFKNKGSELKKQIRDTVGKILEKESGRGIIHSVSYGFSYYLDGLSSRLVFHNSDNKREQLEYYLRTSGAVFVSPSSTRGLDLPGELCEWIVFLKAPFDNLADPQINARLYNSGKMGRIWYTSSCIQNIIQGSGRGFRHEDDWLTVYLPDKQIGKLLLGNTGLWSCWYRELVEFV